MAKSQTIDSNNLDHSVNDLEEQAAAAFGGRLRSRAEEIGRNQTDIARAVGIKRGAMTGYWSGKYVPPANKLFAIADFLDEDARWLASGVRAGGSLVDAASADWIEVPEYDLREITDESLGEPLLRAPIRRDWLFSIVRSTTALWMTRLLSDYAPARLEEGALVICRSVRQEDLAEGHVCLWRVAETVVIGRYSVVPDELLARGSSTGAALAPYLDPSLGISTGDLVVPPSAVNAGRYVPIGRILGTMVQPI